MRRHTQALQTFFAASLLVLFAGSASALGTPPIERIRYELEQGVDSGFGYSGLHDADDSTPMTGDEVAKLYGTLTFDYDPAADLYTLVRADIEASNGIEFDLVAGEISGDGGGFFDYVLSGAGDYVAEARILYTGGEAVCCGEDGPNYINRDQFRLWGAADIEPGDGRIGMDLGGSSTPVPEPTAALLFAVGVAVLSASRRVKASA
jgi:hypothetical protein